MQYMAMTADKLRDDLKEPAVTQIKQQLALDAVCLLYTSRCV